jgi:multidrug efflux pump
LTGGGLQITAVAGITTESRGLSMSKFTDLFVKRPVLAIVVSLLILLLGLRSMSVMQIQQYPEMKNTTIVVTTTYPGASASVIQSFITSILSRSIASAEGVEYLSSSSVQGASVITAHIRLNFDPNKALVNVQSKVLAVSGDLPAESQQPILVKETGSQFALVYLGYISTEMSQSQIADYLAKAVVPAIQAVPGVGKTAILGTTNTAMRIWLDPRKMVAYKVTAAEVAVALQSNNYQSAAGSVSGKYVLFNIDAHTGTADVEAFENLVVQHKPDGSTLKIKDIGTVELGTENYNTSTFSNGHNAVFLSVDASPDANPLSVIHEVEKLLPELALQYPSNLKGMVDYDATEYIRSSIKEVVKTILEATVIVIFIIFLFLGSLRTVFIPVITIPLSLIGVCSLMLVFGFTINLLTLLAMVLAIGLVVDDAIVVVENIYRHVEEGATPFKAAIQGAREIATPVIAMSITLAAVYAPIAFMGGVTGALFTEFAITLAASVVISGVTALTLSPMMCSRMLTHNISEVKFVKIVDAFFTKLKHAYQNRLHSVLQYRIVVLVFALLVLIACVFLATSTHSELAPQEDQGFVMSLMTAPQYSNADYMKSYTEQIEAIYADIPEVENYFIINGDNGMTSGFAGATLKPWSTRKRTQAQILAEVQGKIGQITGLQIVSFPPPSLPTPGSGIPLQFVVGSLSDYKTLAEVSDTLMQAARQSGMFIFTFSDLLFNQPSLNLTISREKAADLGVSMRDIGNTLGLLLGENYLNRFNQQQSSYKVIAQLSRDTRFNPEDLKGIYLRSSKGDMVPLSSLISYEIKPQPAVLNQYQQMNSVTIAGMMKPGFTLKEGLDFLKQTLHENYPKGFTVGYTGESRQLMQESNSMIYTFAFALIVIFLVLAAQFESFRDPLIILVSVPMSICGALIFLNVGFASLNIYTSIGLVTLIGLISKHGILIVDFANNLRDEKQMTIEQAIVESAGLRLRPILMTTAAIVFGVLPLIFSNGPGAMSRYNIGLVIATGMLIGTICTLFVVPTMYTYLTRRERLKVE